MTDQLFLPVKQRESDWDWHDGESVFEFLQRGGCKELIPLRQWMEEWYKAFPGHKQAHLKQRLQSRYSNRNQFQEALFELQVNRILQRLDCSVEHEPDFQGTGGTVDFCAHNNGQKFYVEATVQGFGQGIFSSSKNDDDAVKKIQENINDPHSNIWLRKDGTLNQTLSAADVVRPFKDLLNKFSADDVRAIHDTYGLSSYTSWKLSAVIEVGEWKLSGFLVPLSDGQVTGNIELPAMGGAVDSKKPIIKALTKKARDWKNKKLENAIFLIAINLCHSEFTPGDEREAIFGCDGPVDNSKEFISKLSEVNGIIAVSNGVIGCEYHAPVRLYRNGNKQVPDCLRFLLEEHKLGDLLGIAQH